jgi:hypothetical protein
MTRKLKGTCRLTLIIRRETQLNKQTGLRIIKGWTERDLFSQSHVHCYEFYVYVYLDSLKVCDYVEFTDACSICLIFTVVYFIDSQPFALSLLIIRNLKRFVPAVLTFFTSVSKIFLYNLTRMEEIQYLYRTL